jgi:hypothetical protein
MEKESLNKSIDAIIDSLDKLDIPIEDKVELMINLTKILDHKTYRENINILRLVKHENGRNAKNI